MSCLGTSEVAKKWESTTWTGGVRALPWFLQPLLFKLLYGSAGQTSDMRRHDVEHVRLFTLVLLPIWLLPSPKLGLQSLVETCSPLDAGPWRFVAKCWSHCLVLSVVAASPTAQRQASHEVLSQINLSSHLDHPPRNQEIQHHKPSRPIWEFMALLKATRGSSFRRGLGDQIIKQCANHGTMVCDGVF